MLVLSLLITACNPNTVDSAGDVEAPTAPGLVINEFLAVSETLLEDPDGPDGSDTAEPVEYENFIELYNPTSEIVQYDGFYLTDDEEVKTKWQLPSGTGLGPGEYDLIWADKQPEQGEDHASFKLNGGGEFLGLFYVKDGYDPVAADQIRYGNQVADLSQQRIPDGTEDSWAAREPTPESANPTE